MTDLTEKLKDWSPPSSWQKITTLHTHTAGEP